MNRSPCRRRFHSAETIHSHCNVHRVFIYTKHNITFAELFILAANCGHVSKVLSFNVSLFCFFPFVLQIAGFLGVLWCLSILSCLYSEYTYLPMQINPLILYGFMLLFLINPFKTCYYKSRFWLLKLLVSLLTYLLEPSFNTFITLV